MTSRVEMSKRLVLINSASSLLTRVLNIFVLVWLQQYLLKQITPEEYSLLPVLYSVMMFAPLITTILTGGLGRYIVEAYAKSDDERVTQIVSTIFPILCATGLVFLAGGLIFAWHIGDLLNIAPERLWDARIMMALLMFSAAISLPLSPFGVGFFVRQKFVLQNLIGVGIEIFRLLLLLTLLFGVSTRVLWVVAASVCAGIVGQVIGVIVSRQLVPTLRFLPSHIHWPIAKEITSFGGWSFVAQLADTIRTSADAIILNKLATPLDVTNFHLGSLVMKHTQATVYAVRAPLQPNLTALHATGDTARLGRLYLKGGRYGLWGIQLLVLPLIIFSRELILLYVGSEFAQAAVVMSLLLALFPISYGNMIMPALANATGQMKPWAIRASFLHLTNLTLTFYLVGRLEMGATGSALATFLSSLFLQPCLMWPLGIRLSGVGWRVWFLKTLFPGLLPGIPASAFWLLCRWGVRPESWIGLSASVAPGILLYLLVLSLFCLQDDDKSYIGQVWRRIHSNGWWSPGSGSR